jgi:hypothetical protein
MAKLSDREQSLEKHSSSAGLGQQTVRAKGPPNQEQVTP